jgi:uncharacterized protein with PIN domain
LVDPLTRDFFVLLAGARCTPEAAAFAQLIEDDPAPLISAASVLEAGIVLISHYGLDARGNLRDFLAQGGRQVEPVTSEQVDLALETYQWYGKGRHRAGPNFTIAEGTHRFAARRWLSRRSSSMPMQRHEYLRSFLVSMGPIFDLLQTAVHGAT